MDKKMDKLRMILKRNLNEITKSSLVIMGAAFSALSILLSFVSWDDMGVTSVSNKIVIFILIMIISVVLGIVKWSATTCKTFWDRGKSAVRVQYGNLMKIAFNERKQGRKIVVVPVNTTFDTIVDSKLENNAKPLVSPGTIHGQWINYMVAKGIQVSEIDSRIEDYMQKNGITCVKELSQSDKSRGKLKIYDIGTTVIMDGENGTEFFLAALSEFNENNNAQSSKRNVIQCISRILEAYDRKGQGYDIYIPLMGTGQSRAGLTHTESLRIIKSVLIQNTELIRGTVNVVIYGGDRDKVAIFD